MLSNVLAWLDKAEAHAKTKGFEPGVLLASRLAPDQFPLLRQLQSVCDHAKFGAARLTGKTPPANPDTEQTLEEIRQRIRTTLAYLETFQASDFEGADTRQVKLPFLENKAMLGRDYFFEMAQPNFYFHLVTVYAILRHNGVELGKRDFVGSVRLQS